ncbi:GNAT family N-acetyltransferase [Limosilactobacillus caecicola]|uniref:GNAT family N-acetyltransferase n=1 Tax=Limosilactobacillus caecicola TaxID=2941332 RepID=UPI00203EC5EF|nr:GNAT family N-acetyltransferase [Limosilactobacillus caecicola]
MENDQQAKSRLLTRRLTTSDEDALIGILQDRSLAASAGLILIGDQQTQRWVVQHWLTDAELYGIYDRRRLVGLIAIFSVQQGGEIGYFILPEYRHQHVMTNAVRIVLQQTRFEQLVAEVEKANLASQRVLINNHFGDEDVSGQLVRFTWQK